MQRFIIPTPDVSVTPGCSSEADQLITNILNEGTIGFAELISAIQYENKAKFGPSSISNVLWRVIDYQPSSLTGRLRVGYDMQLTFGCEDFVKDHLNQHSYYNFKINQPERTVAFESDQPEPPSTADEF